MFESITGQKASEYAHQLKKTPHQTKQRASFTSLESSQSRSSSWTDKRTSMLHLFSDTIDVPNTKTPSLMLADTTTKPRPISTSDDPLDLIETSFSLIDTAVGSGIFFGIGLFSLIFSLLPPRVNKILNTLGFHSSRPFALHLLLKSFKSHGLYSSLSALSLLAYYTNLSLFIHPKLLPKSLSLDTARQILDRMKITFPQGKIWKLLEGKLCKMEGKTRRGVEILRDARRRENARVDLIISSSTYHYQQQKTNKKKSGSASGCSELAQLQALAVYEMGWGQIFLGDFFQAAETFFRLESMNNWSRAFYHYIATCCMFADEEYDKSALEFMQIPSILKRKRQLGGRLLPNEIFAERKIKHWRSKNK
ncbi:Mitochondrial outer membrane protein iml2, partial [Choanephora cucurbitarum]